MHTFVFSVCVTILYFALWAHFQMLYIFVQRENPEAYWGFFWHPSFSQVASLKRQVLSMWLSAIQAVFHIFWPDGSLAVPKKKSLPFQACYFPGTLILPDSPLCLPSPNSSQRYNVPHEVFMIWTGTSQLRESNLCLIHTLQVSSCVPVSFCARLRRMYYESKEEGLLHLTIFLSYSRSIGSFYAADV